MSVQRIRQIVGETMITIPIRNRAPNGVTLVELMVTLAVFAILATIGIPSYANLVANNRATATANELLSTLQFARSEAVKRNEDIIAEPVATSNWSDGWTVFRDANNDDELRSRHAQHPSVTITGPSSLRFRPAGNVVGAGPFTITIADTASATRCLTLEASGRGLISREGC